MPELPDLQVFSRNLTKALKDKKLEKISALNAKKLNVSEQELNHTLKGEVLTKVERSGKQLHLIFKNGHVLGLHLMLHGELHLTEKGALPQKYAIISFEFDDGTALIMSDFQAAATPTLDPDEAGVPDALDIDEDDLTARLEKTKKPVKTVLMDQHIIRGIGNAYADEILWHARLSPFSVSNKIPASKIKTLAQSIKAVLKDAEKQILNARPDTISGEYRDFLEIHKSGKKHTSTGAVIHQKELSSRKTYYTDEQELYQ